MTDGPVGRPASTDSVLIAGRYHLLRPLARGGMAEVFKAALKGPQGFERSVAIKRILPHLSTDEEFRTMFVDEAKIATLLTHPNIVQVYELGEEEGNLYIVMEFVDGRDLRSLMDMIGSEGLPVSIVAFIGREVALALDYAHRKDIVHRDVSPHNLLLSREGEVKLTDFGIAKASLKASETSGGMLKGKIAYMSPEQASGLPLDARTDIFSLGIVLFEILTGQRLFLADTDMSTLKNVQEAKVPLLSSVRPHIPRDMEDAILRALKKSPRDRFASSRELAEEMDRVLMSSGVRTPRDVLKEYLRDGRPSPSDVDLSEETSHGTQMEKSFRNGRRKRMLGISAAAALLGLAGTGTWFYGKEDDRIAVPSPSDHLQGQAPTISAAGLFPSDTTAAHVTAPTSSSLVFPPHSPRRNAVKPRLPEKRDGILNIGSKPWAEVYIDGIKLTRTTPVMGVKVPEGRHRVKFVNPALRKVTEVDIDVKGGEEMPLIVDLVKGLPATPSGR